MPLEGGGSRGGGGSGGKLKKRRPKRNFNARRGRSRSFMPGIWDTRARRKDRRAVTLF